MADLKIPAHLIDLQRRANAAFQALADYQKAVGKPSLEWTDEDRAPVVGLWAEITSAGDALRAAVVESPLLAEHGSYVFQQALMAAAKPMSEDGEVEA